MAYKDMSRFRSHEVSTYGYSIGYLHLYETNIYWHNVTIFLVLDAQIIFACR